jgi:hypothetical protein
MLVAIIGGIAGSIAATGCGKSADPAAGTGGASSQGGATATGGSGQSSAASGGTSGFGGQTGAGGSIGTGGRVGADAALDASDAPSAGGSVSSGGTLATSGGSGSGGTSGAGGLVSRDGGSADLSAGTGGAGSGGTLGTGGARGGTSGTTVGGGGSVGSGGPATGGSSTSTGSVIVDCNAALPSNGELHTGNTHGTAGALAWSLWSNGSGATMTTFDRPAFRMTWGPNSSDALARLGLDFGDSGLTYDQYGPITAQFSETKSGSGGGYSYIGIYGFSTDPCVEFYIVDDSYTAMPFKAWSAADKGTVTIDGDSYTLYSGTLSSTDSSSCRGSIWYQFYSIRQTARTCGQISITQHFDAWKAAGMKLGKLAQVQVLAEVGGGTGSIDFPVANVVIGP